jgi:hypothetical protein
MDAQQQNVIFRKYGDYLYQKADYDGAMQQYLKAIDNTEPSQVIRKVRLPLTINRFCTDLGSISIHNEYII